MHNREDYQYWYYTMGTCGWCEYCDNSEPKNDDDDLQVYQDFLGTL